MTHPPFGLSQIGQVSLTVGDLERATAFYRDALGMKYLFSVPNMSFFDCAGIRLMLAIPQGAEEKRGNSILYFRVGSILDAHDTLVSRGVHFERAPFLVARLPTHDLWMAFFRDSEQNLLSLMAELPKQDHEGLASE